ncbi:MAG: tetratricopeptide repeat protein [Anaerolineae bacterium]|jgi:tetratricopeptide (TPR) repeat protein|uniref:tetratricopeptide repeat protein n=1 Tax=Candidatus Flexifilum breve TaxID=3140694 RepID=UPI001ACB4E2B|nr:tetratricopeptide repeat protein [Chloroflexota bacterium]MBK9751467.1 tetratricopeptide repeat protein [Chloroflexota bacterium]MBN8638724.1 tetratricopeptide repeat protein [Anaerolineae bacterium]
MRRQWLVGVYVTFVLAFVGLVVFIGGLAAELFSSRAPQDALNLSPYVVLALGGLCLAALMFVFWFGLVGVLLARQTRAQGSGYGEAYRLIEAFKFRDAIPLLERSIREGKETAEVLMLLTSAYAYTGQLAKAQATADRAVQLFPNDPDSYITLANGYRLQAAYDEAAGTLMRAATLSPDQPVIWAELGFTQRFAGNEAAAVESFEKAAAHAMPAPYGVRVFYHLSNAYSAAGETKKAMRAIAKMMSARDGLVTWKSGLKPLEGTAYGQALRYEIAAIDQAIADADAGNLG